MRTLAFLFLPLTLWAQAAPVPPDFKVAFIGDQGLGSNAQDVLKLIKSEGAQLVLHQGDLDYKSKPDAWEKQIDEILGADFPYVASAGNHDIKKWPGEGGYQARLEARLKRLGIEWEGELGIQSSIRYKGLFIVLVAPGVKGKGHAEYIRDQMAKDKSVWRICSWHKNMKLLQAGGKKDETGWEVYEEARKAGAIIATGHEHSYSRTHLLSDFTKQEVADADDSFTIAPGKTFAFVSGLGGKSIRSQKLKGDWWAKVYTSTQKARYGALFATFHADGQPGKAVFTFKNVDGEVVDRFTVLSGLAGD
jgi:predicted phosphodiesterase